MRNIITIACVKFVNNQRNTVSIISGYMSTKKVHALMINIIQTVKVLVYKTSLRYLSPVVSTYKNGIFYLLNKSFTHYPQHLLLESLKEN